MQPHRNRTSRVQAIVLARKDWGEADRLLTLLTPDKGKLRVLAPAARKPTSRKSGHVELFSLGTFMLAHGRTFDKITQAETLAYYPTLREDLDRVSAAYVMVELVDRFMQEHDENGMVFDVLQQGLMVLDGGAPVSLVLRFFEVKFLGYVGYQPQLYACQVCDEELEAVAQFYHPLEASVVCPKCAATSPSLLSLSVDALKVLRFLQINPWDKVQRLALSPALERELERVTHRTISAILERDVNAIRFMDELQR
jgi:DNA repair protein RecO (recombination protein O)